MDDPFPTPGWVHREAPGLYKLEMTVMIDSDDRAEARELLGVAMESIRTRLRLWGKAGRSNAVSRTIRS